MAAEAVSPQETQGAGGNAGASRVWKGNEELDDLLIWMI